MARLMIEDAAGLTVRDVIHSRFSALPANATVSEVRAWFAESSHRQMAVLADQGRYVGSLTRAALADEAEAERPAAELSHPGPVIAPDEPASAGSELALSTGTLRVPVVDHDGTLLGVIGVTDDLEAFCGAA
jgi:CBS-domain-containing membrane protein